MLSVGRTEPGVKQLLGVKLFSAAMFCMALRGAWILVPEAVRSETDGWAMLWALLALCPFLGLFWLGIGLLRSRSWAWKCAIVLGGACIVSAVVFWTTQKMFGEQSVLNTIFVLAAGGILTLGYFLRPAVKAQFTGKRT